jgi:D-3-phosphoglycerate dehydrogenase
MNRRWSILCAGDNFISPELMADSVRGSVGEGCDIRLYRTNWPIDPSRFSDDIREWAGDQAELSDAALDAEIIVTHNAPIGRLLLDRARLLKLVACCRGGPANVDVGVATSRGVTVVNAPGRNAEATAEFAVALLLAGVRRIAEASATMRTGGWDRSFYKYDRAGMELSSRTLGVVGLGRVGRKVATILAAFGGRVLAFDPYTTPAEFEASGAESVELGELLDRSDIVTVHARLSAETRHLLNDAAFSRMKPGAYFVNTARGGLVDYDALAAHLRSGHLSGAALDVFPEEPLPPEHPLRQFPNILMTPHIAGATKEAAYRGASEVAEDVGRYCRGEPMLHVFNQVVLTR